MLIAAPHMEITSFKQRFGAYRRTCMRYYAHAHELRTLDFPVHWTLAPSIFPAITCGQCYIVMLFIGWQINPMVIVKLGKFTAITHE